MGRYGEIWGGVKSETSWGTATWSEYASRDAGAYRIVEPGNPSKQTKSPGETPRVAARRKRCGLYGTLSGECSAAEPTHSYHPWMDVGLCKSGGRGPPPPRGAVGSDVRAQQREVCRVAGPLEIVGVAAEAAEGHRRRVDEPHVPQPLVREEDVRPVGPHLLHLGDMSGKCRGHVQDMSRTGPHLLHLAPHRRLSPRAARLRLPRQLLRPIADQVGEMWGDVGRCGEMWGRYAPASGRGPGWRGPEGPAQPARRRAGRSRRRTSA